MFYGPGTAWQEDKDSGNKFSSPCRQPRTLRLYPGRRNIKIVFTMADFPTPINVNQLKLNLC